MQIDYIVTHPIHLDYPLWRKFIRDYGSFFSNVIVSFTDHHLPANDYTKDIHSWIVQQKQLVQMGNPIILEKEEVDITKDWRHEAVMRALKHSDAPYVWFGEQDFFANWPIFLTAIKAKILEGIPLIGFVDDTKRLHPACLIVRRDLLEQTCMDFSPSPPEHDHFGRLKFPVPATLLEDLDLWPGNDWYHMQGLSHNYQLAMQNKMPVFKPLEFAIYNQRARAADVEQLGNFIDLSYRVDRLLLPAAKLMNGSQSLVRNAA